MGEIFKVILIPIFNKLIEKLNRDEYTFLFYLFSILIVLIIISIRLIVFYCKNKKMINEIGKTGQEHIKGLLENTKILHNKRDEKLESDKSFFDKTYYLIEKLKNNDDQLLQDDIIEYKELFRNCTYKKLQEYMDYIEIIYKEDKTNLLHFIQNDILPALNNIKDFQELINSNRIQKITQHSEYKSTNEELFSYYYFIKKNTSFFNIKIRRKANAIMQEIGVDLKFIYLKVCK